MIETFAFPARGRDLGLAIIVAFIACLFVPRQVKAQSLSWATYDLPQIQQTTLKSAAGAPYRIILAKPSGPVPAAGYPVIYVVDGNAWTALVSEIIRANMEVGVQSRVEPAVVVGIGYPTDRAFDLTRRTLDFTSPLAPGHFDSNIRDPTGGDIALMDFIDTKVKPVIEAHFKIDRDRQTLLGHSLGGLFTLLTMCNRPQSFQTYVALSPSIWWDHDALLQEARQFIDKADRPQKLRVFLSVGDLEQYMTPAYVHRTREVLRGSFNTEAKANEEADKEMSVMKSRTMVDNVRRMAQLLNTAHIQTRFVEFPDEDHFSGVPAALGRAIPFALGDDLPPN
jgi:predicted alpha/beta superfamily hydrolase